MCNRRRDDKEIIILPLSRLALARAANEGILGRNE